MFTVKAVMNDIGVIEVSIIRSFYDGISNTFYLKNQFGEMTQLRIMSCKKESNAVKYYLDGSNIKIGEEYYIVDDHNYVASLEFGMIVKSSQFDSAYFYDGDDLGPTYTKEATTFKVWAPTASVAFVQLVNKGDIETYQMKRDNGVYSVTINGDLDGKYYQYLVKVNGVFNTSIDPYAYASSPNHEYSCVIDLEKTNVNLNKDNLKVLDSYCDAIIYELSVRDISYDDHSNIKNKSKFLGLTEEGTKTNKNYPTGLDYIASLGVTHVQLQPIYDFGSVEETNQFLKYNWGYDPVQYNVPEGSFASDVYDPYSRVIDCKKMIAAFHKKGIRVNMDVVYNHVFDRFTSSFEKLVPYYYFRFQSNGNVSNGSFCGNDFDSTRKMASKFIVDSVKRWMTFYGIDGFRFDLMGIIDIETMKKVQETTKKIDDSAMVYGEGWDMPTALNDDMKAAMKNEAKLPNIGHFNDRFREIVKGSTWHDELSLKGYASGDSTKLGTFINVMMGSCTDINIKALFNSPEKSINYVECHDNTTLWDKLMVSNKEEPEEIRKKRQRLIFAILILSQGVPFFHSGQEFFRTKNGEHNSYISPDKVNRIDYKLMEKNYDSVIFSKDMINFRKEHKIFRLTSKEEILKRYSYEEKNGLLIITIDCTGYEEKYSKIKLIINNSNKICQLSLDDYYRILINEFGEIKIEMFGQNLMINPVSLLVVAH
jgi:pullulanase